MLNLLNNFLDEMLRFKVLKHTKVKLKLKRYNLKIQNQLNQTYFKL